MKNFLKYGVISAAVFLLLLCATVMLLPVLINVQKFQPQIENQISDKTGRPFHIGSDFGLTFFPWLSVTFSDAHLGNPKGVTPGDFISVDSFEARVKLLPLLFNKVEVSRFIVSGLDVNLTREESGAANWELAQDKGDTGYRFVDRLLNKDLDVELLAVTDGTLVFQDKQNEKEYMLDDIMLILNGISPDAAAKAEFKVGSGDHMVKGSGTVGPVSKDVTSLFVDISMQLDDSVNANIKGECSYPLYTTECDLKVHLPSFSVASFYGVTEGAGNDGENTPPWGKAVKLDGYFHGNMKKFTVDNGIGFLDENNFTYNVQFDREAEIPTELEIHFTTLDARPYFNGMGGDEDQGQSAPRNYLRPLAKANFLARIGSDELHLFKSTLHEVTLRLQGEEGKVKLDEGAFLLHGGKGVFSGTVGLETNPLTFDTDVKLQQVQAEPLSQDILGTSFVSGLLQGSCSYRIPGLEGSELGDGFLSKGYLTIENGSLKGVSLFDTEAGNKEQNTSFAKLTVDTIMGPKAMNLQSLLVEGEQGKTELHGGVDLQDKTFTILTQKVDDEAGGAPLTGTFSSDGIALAGYGDEEEAVLPEVRDIQSIVDEKIPSPSQEDVANSQGTSLIDAAVVAQRFGLKRELITPTKTKKTYKVGEGRVVIHGLQELDSVDTF